jgi:putative ABC transport system substrate-binding protein
MKDVNRSRRQFVTALSAGALAGVAPRRPFAASMKRVAVLGTLDGGDSKARDRYLEEGFIKPLAELGWRDGVNLKVVLHVHPLQSDWAETAPPVIRAVASGKYDGAIVEGEFLTRRLRQEAPSLPIAAYLYDPVGQGFARTLAKPGGTVTGSHRGMKEVYLKQMDILRRLVPGTTRMGWISFKPMLETAWSPFASAAAESGITVKRVMIEHKGGEFPGLAADFEMLHREGYRCAHFMGGISLDVKAVGELALRHRMALSFWGAPQDFQQEGLLLQYRSTRDGVEARLCAAMAQILRGQHPGDIPFEGPTNYQLRLNLKTAARIGVKVPDDVLLMMDEVLR